MSAFKIFFCTIAGAIIPLGIAVAFLYYTTGIANIPDIFQTDAMELDLFIASIAASWPYMIGGAVAGLLVGMAWSARD